MKSLFNMVGGELMVVGTLGVVLKGDDRVMIELNLLIRP